MNNKYKFNLLCNEKCIRGNLVYNKDCGISFESEEKIKRSVFSLMIGKGYNCIDFDIITHKAIGFICEYNPMQLWKQQEMLFPKYKNGEIYLENKFEEIMDGQWYIEDWNTYYDQNKKIVCLGDYKLNARDISIEFCSNVIAVFSDNKLKSIWFKNIKF